MKVDRKLNTFTQSVLSDHIEDKYLSIVRDFEEKIEPLCRDFLKTCFENDIESTSMSGAFYNVINKVFITELVSLDYELCIKPMIEEKQTREE